MNAPEPPAPQSTPVTEAQKATREYKEATESLRDLVLKRASLQVRTEKLKEQLAQLLTEVQKRV